MRKMYVFLVSVVMIVVLVAGVMSLRPEKKLPRWVVYYSSELPFETFNNYDIVVLDSDDYPEFTDKRENDKQVLLGYLSTSEAEEYRPYYDEIVEMDVMMGESPLWEGHIIIDIRKPEWRDYFINMMVPLLMVKGVDGIMLDTIDSVIYLEEEFPEEYEGMKEAAVLLIAGIRKAHPDIKVMLNRGLPILERLAPHVDYVLAESIRVRYDFETGDAEYFPDHVYKEERERLKEAKKLNPNLKVVTLDYWNMRTSEEAAIRNIYAEHRSHGFIPYVTTVRLNEFHPEPK